MNKEVSDKTKEGTLVRGFQAKMSRMLIETFSKET